MGFAERILTAIFNVSRYHAWLVLLVALAITGAAVYYIQELPVRSSFIDLLPQDDELIDEYLHHEEYLAQTDYLALLVELTKPGALSVDEREGILLTAAEKIANLLRTEPEFSEVDYLSQPSANIPEQYLLLYTLDNERLKRIEESVSLAESSISNGELSLLPQESLRDAYSQVGKAFESVSNSSILQKQGLRGVDQIRDGLGDMITLNKSVLAALDGITKLPEVTSAVQGLTEIFISTDQATRRKPQGYFSGDRTMLLMNVQPRLPAQQGVDYCTKVMEALNSRLEGLDLEELGVTVAAAGPYAYSAETNAVINTDMYRTTIISSIGVFVIFLLAFGSFFYSIIAVIPLLISLALTLGWVKFVMGGFNLITSFLPALVLGLGIDYGIHFISRYAEERKRGSPLNPALKVATLYKGKASAAAAITTALVFLSLLFSRSRGLFEMGAIASVGVIISFISTLILLPALITLAHFVFRFRHREMILGHSIYLFPFFRFVVGKGRTIFSIVIILTFFVSFQAAHITFQFSGSDLVPHTESEDTLARIMDNFGGAKNMTIGEYFTFFANEDELGTVIARLQENKFVGGVQSARDLLPPNLSEQQKTLSELNIESYIKQLSLLDEGLSKRQELLSQLRLMLPQFSLLQYGATLNGMEEITIDSNRIQTQLQLLQHELGSLDLEEAQGRISALQSALRELDQNLGEVQNLPPIEALLQDIVAELPEGIRARYLTPDNEYIIYARVSDELYNEDNLEKFISYAKTFSDKYFGMILVGKRLQDYLHRDFWLSTILALVLIAISLRRSMGKWTQALLAGAPLILGYIWMLGGMKLLEVEFNFINIVISPLLIGIGVDDGIHLLHRYLEERKREVEGAIERSGALTAAALIVTSLTTMLVFGSLLLARTPGLQCLGISALLGIGFTLIFSLLFLPAALHVTKGKRL